MGGRLLAFRLGLGLNAALSGPIGAGTDVRDTTGTTMAATADITGRDEVGLEPCLLIALALTLGLTGP